MTRDDQPEAEALTWLLETSHELAPAQLPAALTRAGRMLGADDVLVLMPDYNQRELRPFLAPASDRTVRPAAVATTDPGRAYAEARSVLVGAERDWMLWHPMLDGTERVGVLGFSFVEKPPPDRQRWCRHLTALAAELVVTKSLLTDVIHRARRGEHMNVAAEMQWHLLPPLTMRVPEVAVAGILEPAYGVGGDAFDYALDEELLHLAIFDAMGHGVTASLMATLAVATYRHGRRQRVPLEEQHRMMDDAVQREFGDNRFVTAQIGELELASGRLRWINAGHPAPVSIRPGQRLMAIEGEGGSLPVGLGGPSPRVDERQLTPGEKLVFFTDGVVENRRADDDLAFGVARLYESIEEEAPRGGPAAEVVRRISVAAYDFHAGAGRDDASILLVEWRGP